MKTTTLDILIAVTVALIVAISLAIVIETIAFGDVHIDAFINSFST